MSFSAQVRYEGKKNNKKVTDNKNNTTTLRPGCNTARVGLFGGTFNPVHLGHMEIARDVKRAFNLDKVLVVPSATPPHKKVEGIVGAKDRLEMVKMCFGGLDGFEVSDIELKRNGPSYTIDSVNDILSRQTEGTDLFLIIGTDAFFEIHTWRKYNDLLDSVKLIIMTRPGDQMESSQQKKNLAGGYISEKITSGYHWDAEQECFNHLTKKSLYFFNVTQLDISSTRIRQYIKDMSCAASSLLNNEVADYITKKGLYK